MSGETTGFLYPFIEADERDTSGLLADLAESARLKIIESGSLSAATLEGCVDMVKLTGRKMADRFRAGGRLFAFGNGGSATDADGIVELFRNPPMSSPLPAVSLVSDSAVLTALSNDVGYELSFSRQLIAHARAGDMAIGFSTSGNSPNLLRAFEEAARRKVLTLGLSGYDGGAMAASGSIDHCFTVRSESVHRIQEAQDALVWALWCTVDECMREGESP